MSARPAAPPATFALLPGAGSGPGYWQLLVDELHERGFGALAVDLPCDDDAAGLAEYADAAVAAIGEPAGPLVLVAHSFGGFTAPLVCERRHVDLLVLVQAMIPAPGERPGEWWESTGHAAARAGADESAEETFMHDVAPLVRQLAVDAERRQSPTPFGDPWPLAAWPGVPTRFLLCSEDRFFPAPFMRRVVSERLGIVPDQLAAGHLPMLARPLDLAARLEAFAAELEG